MEQKFTISKSNKIYFGVVAVLLLGYSIVVREATPYQQGYLAGTVACFLLFSLLFAWIVWRLSGKKGNVGSLAFNIVLTLLLLGQIGQSIGQSRDKIRQSQALEDIQKKKVEFKKVVSTTDDPLEIESACKNYTESVEKGLGSLSETSTGAEKQFFKIMSEFVSEVLAAAQKWGDSFDAVQSPSILDYSLLNSDEEFDRQRKVLRLYIEETKAYEKFLTNMVPNLKKRLSVLGERSDLARGAVKGATKKYLSQKPILEPLMQAQIEYANNMTHILDLLQKNKGEWSYENGELLIDNDSVLNKCNELIKAIGNNEATIKTLSAKLIEKL